VTVNLGAGGCEHKNRSGVSSGAHSTALPLVEEHDELVKDDRMDYFLIFTVKWLSALLQPSLPAR
jgi:hypothetical protein